MDVSEVDSIAASARDALKEVAGLLDTQDGGVYVFAGQDTGNPPVPDPDNILASGFYSQINAAICGLSPTVNNAATVAQTAFDAAKFGGTASPFSTYLSATPSPCAADGAGRAEPDRDNRHIRERQRSDPCFAVSRPDDTGWPAQTTGSYMRDVLRALATIGSLSSGQASEPGFATWCRTRASVCRMRSPAMAQDAGVLGNVQSSLTTTQSRLADTQTAMTSQVSSAEDVDMAATLSQLSLVQTQMQASYQLIATLNGLSLAKFLPAS